MSSRKISLNGTKATVETSTFSPQNDFLTLKESYLLSASRAEGDTYEVDIQEDDNIEFVFDDGTAWFGNTETLHELFPDIDVSKRSSGDVVELPFMLSGGTDSRSIKSVALKIFNVFAKSAVKQGVKELATYLEKQLLDDQSGLYQVNNSFELSEYTIGKTDTPFLLFLHGTGSSTKGSFSELTGSELWAEMNKMYKNILAFQHETFTKSPLQNVYELVQQLPDTAILHVISHSRGGLVGEVLARFCYDENGFNEAGIEMLKRVGRKEDITHIDAIKQIMLQKKLRVEKFIRVACPARGTSILSKRLDFYFNVTMNLISFAGGTLADPIVGGFKALISAILDSKNDVHILPGLESMCPSSPFLKVLNAPDRIQGNLTVISGNANYSVSLKALVVIVSKLVFQDDNDFVVNTVSMYQGAQREKPLRYFFDEGAEVNHFSYFKNARTRQAILTVLTSKDDNLPAFKEYVPLGLDETQRGVFGLEGGAVFYDKVSGRKPIAVVLPGIMGSNLSRDGSGVWINYLKLISGGLVDLDPSKPGIKPSSLIKTSYKKLCSYLSDEYDVVTFPFDWRLSVSESAKYLNDKIKFLLSYKQPIKIIAHSMGGVLVKEFILNHGTTWNQLNKSPDFKLLMLGTPWMGSYRIPHVFAGRDGIIKQLSSLDFSHSKEELISLFSKFPGILNLLPVRPSDKDFSKREVWIELQKSSQLIWNIPSKEVLADFAKFRKNTIDHAGNIDFTNVRYIAGKDDTTQIGYEVVKGELQFKLTGKGDQSVTWELGIPDKLKNTPSLYYSNVTHGALACDEKLFPAIKQLIQKGTTELLSRIEPVVNDNVSRSLVQTQHEEIFETDEVSAIHTILGIPLETVRKKQAFTPLKVNVSNGDLMFSNYPVIVGHFKGDGIVSAERVADNYVKGELSIKHALGNYPGEIGSHQLLIRKEEEFNGVCVVGLGEVDKLSALVLATTIEKAMIQYLLDHGKENQIPNGQVNGISVLLIGTDYGGLSVESSIRSILLGVQNANTKISQVKQDQIRLIEHVEFVELFEDRALQAFYSLKKIMSSTSDEVQIEFKSAKIKKLLGCRKRLLLESKSDWWQRLTVLSENDPAHATVKHLSFYTATTGAREEKKELQSNSALIDNLLESISTDEHWTPQVAKTIFELLIPNEFKENIKRQTDILWVLDKHTASYPWELFQTDIERSKPLCINAGMIRQLATTDYKANTTPVNNKHVLIIGDPLTDGFCNQLPGAEKEANAITQLFGMFDYDIESLVKRKSSDIVTALFRQEYKIVHISGHGNFDKDDPEKSGMIIGNNIFLTPREFNQLSYTPELVFVNCCHLGKVDPEQENLYGSRYKFAANIGTQLIQNGVKVVIAAGWAVDDAAALEFANIFYQRMFDGYEFGKAVLEARKVIFEKYPYTNTWGAFQCYGDPFYKLKILNKRTAKTHNYIIPQEAENDVENLISKAQIQQGDPNGLRQELDAIYTAIQDFRVETPDLLERVAIAYVEVNDYKKAIDIFRNVLTSEKATYSVSSLEKYNNILAKQLLTDYLEGKNKKINFKKEIDVVITSLTKLLEIAETSERHSLIGSAYKRKAAICDLKTEKTKALTQAAFHYFKAHERDQSGSAYSLVNWLEIEFFLTQLGAHSWGTKRKGMNYTLPPLVDVRTKLEACKEKLDAKIEHESVDYWDLVSNANTALCLWLLKGVHKADDESKLTAAYTRTWEFVGSTNKKMSEIEHFNLLIDFSALLKTKTVSVAITKLRNELEKAVR